jgi:D-alanyl-D-alanine endopeptidase (penicillin-binding protein 7)
MTRFFRRASVVAQVLAAMSLLSAPAHAKAPAAAKKKPPKAAAKAAHKKPVMLERHVVATKSGQPNVQALGALVVDDMGHQIFARNPDKERPIASISKLAAVLAVMDKGLELEGLSTISKTDVEVAKGGAKSRLLEGMTLSNRDLLHAALMGSDNRAIPALGRAVKLNPAQLTSAMNAQARQLGLKATRFHEPTGLSTGNVSTPREVISMLKAVIAHPVLGPITRRMEYDAHPVGKPPIRYNNTDHQAARGNVQLLGGKTGYNDDARYCLVVGTKIDGRTYYMSFLANEGKLTRFGDVARVADWVIAHPFKPGKAEALAKTDGAKSGPSRDEVASAATTPSPLPVGVAAPPPEPAAAAPAESAAAPAEPAAAPAPSPAGAPSAPTTAPSGTTPAGTATATP